MFTSLWRDHRSLLGALALALLLRAAVLWRYAPMLDEDRDLYRQIAEQVVAGKGYSRPLQWRYIDPFEIRRGPSFVPPDSFSLVSDPEGGTVVFWIRQDDTATPADLVTGKWIDYPTAYRPPLYPMLLAGTISLLQTHRAVALVHLMLGLATVGLTMYAAARLNLPAVSSFAGVLVALDPLLLYHTPQVMTETLAAFLAASLLVVAALPHTWRRASALGILLGLACLCRPTFFVVAAIWLPIDLLAAVQSAKVRDRFRHSVLIALSLLMVILPWGVRNRFVLGHGVLSTTHGGYTLYLAHNALYTKRVVKGPWESGWQHYSSDLYRLQNFFSPEMTWEMTEEFEVEVDRQYSEEAWKYMRSDPWTAVRSGLTLWRRMWSVVPQQTEGISLPVRTAIGLFYGVTFALAGLGVLSLFRSDWSGWLPALALIIGFTTVHFFYWADMRMRTPLTPAIALLAARGASRFVRREPASP